MASDGDGPGGRYVDVQQGDTLISLAHAEGFRSWETIYNHPKNAELREKRPGGHQLYPGDRVFIPDKQVKEFTVTTDRRHTFVLRSLKAYVRMIVGDDQDVYAGCRYVLIIDSTEYEGETDSQGLVEVQIPADSKEGTLKVWPPEADEPVTWSVKLGHLDPIDTEDGVKGRLMNLGFDPGESEEDYKNALALFQERYGLSPSGELDEATRSKILEQHLD
jgi:hypothetical protein